MWLRWSTILAIWPCLQSRPTSGHRLFPSGGLMFRRYKGGAAACRLPVLHQGKVNLIGVSAAAPALPDQAGGGQFFHRLNDFVIAHLHFAGQGAAGVDDEHLAVVVDPAVEPGELEAVE